MILKHATLDQLQEIYQHFYNNRKWFPHIRKDYLQRQIKNQCVVYEDGVVIIYNKYKRKQKIGNCTALKDDIILHQILNCSEGSGKAFFILDKFFNYTQCNVWLTVRKENDRAIKFYEKCGMQLVGETSWLKGKMPGLVFIKKYDIIKSCNI